MFWVECPHPILCDLDVRGKIRMNAEEFWFIMQKKLAPENSEPIYLIFLCAGNICRSPYAEMMFEQLINESSLQSKDRFKIQSGGFIDNKKINLHVNSRQALLDDGVPEERVNRFHTRHMRFFKEDLAAADALIVMSKDNAELVNMKYREKVVHLSELVLNGIVEDVKDPVLIQNYAEYRMRTNRIREMLCAFVDKIKKMELNSH